MISIEGLQGLNEITHVKHWQSAWYTVGLHHVLVYDPRKSLKTPTVSKIKHLVFINSVAILPSAPIWLNTAEHFKHNIELFSSINKVCSNASCILAVSA